MTIFNPRIEKTYPTMLFCKSVNNETTEVIFRIENVQFYDITGDVVTIYTFPKNEWNGKQINKNIEGYDFISVEKPY